jgi:hypothetical protein
LGFETLYHDYSRYQLRSQKDLSLSYPGFYKKYINDQPILADEGEVKIKVEYTVPSEYLIYFINRKIVQRDIYLTKSNRYHTKIFGRPLFTMVNKQTTGREIYEEVWMRARFMLNFTHIKYSADANNFWWN